MKRFSTSSEKFSKIFHYIFANYLGTIKQITKFLSVFHWIQLSLRYKFRANWYDSLAVKDKNITMFLNIPKCFSKKPNDWLICNLNGYRFSSLSSMYQIHFSSPGLLVNFFSFELKIPNKFSPPTPNTKINK